MDSSTPLDYALFQLTPTRTRCDLVVVYGGGKSHEKLASGLFEPFIAHLGFAKDQISKGGYSIKLSPPPPNPTTNTANWFTKHTFQSFVRFVSTPAILERFVSLEKEISQIDSSIQASECANVAVQSDDGSGLSTNGIKTNSTDSSKPKSELERLNDVSEESSKYNTTLYWQYCISRIFLLLTAHLFSISRVQLQRLLEARKTMLRRDQAMAYASAFVAGFGLDDIDDLISFADAFKASRLRESCMKFKELCWKKQADRQWMAELAAVEACSPSELSLTGTSGIVITNPINTPDQNMMLNVFKNAQKRSADAIKSDTSSDSQKDGSLAASDNIPSANPNVQIPMQWPNMVPHYMYNPQGHIQQLPPYQGYMYPPHYNRHMPWPTTQKSSSGKRVNRKKEEDSGSEDEQITDSDDSDTGSDSESDSTSRKGRKHSSSKNKKHNKKKQSKTVVIRNINYITPDGRNGEAKGIDVNSSELNGEDVIDAIQSLSKPLKSKSTENIHIAENGCDNGVAKRSENWDDFKNLLMKGGDVHVNEVERLQSVDFQDNVLKSEKVQTKVADSGDSLITNQRNGGYEDRTKLVNFENEEIILKRRDFVDNSLILSRVQDSETDCRGASSEPSIIRSRRGDDSFIANGDAITERKLFDGDCIFASEKDSYQTENTRKNNMFVDDSIMVQARSSADCLTDTQWKTDINMILEQNQASANFQKENGNGEALQDQRNEPDDLYMLLERNSVVNSENISRSMDYGIESNFNTDKKLPSNDKNIVTKSCELPRKKDPSKEARPKVLRGSLKKSDNLETMSKSKKLSLLSRPKSKLDKDEDIRNKMEELAIERQKRIAERTAAMGSSQRTSKKAPLGSGNIRIKA
ncbi:hypothetical protein ACFE04_020282 [Oxalis oulophora]